MTETKKKTRKKSTKKATKKKAKKVSKNKTNEEFSLEDIETELKAFGVSTLKQDDPEEEIAPHKIPFRNLALQKITGGVFGGKFFEIGAQSQAGKSYLLYEIAADAQKMGGYVLLLDGERALEESYAKMVGLNMRSGRFLLAEKRTAKQKKEGMRGTPIVDIDEFFRLAYAFVKSIRQRVPDLSKPILIGVDSYPMLRTETDLTQMEKGKDPKGFAAMQKAAKFYEALAKYLPKYDEYGADLFLLNQLTKNTDIKFGDPWESNAENKIKFYATQRLKGKLVGKLTAAIKGTDKKRQIGMKTQWKCIKNRGVQPFQDVTIKVRYNSGIDKYSGLEELLKDDQTIRDASRKIDSPKTGKKITQKGFKLIKDENGEFFPTIKELVEKHPEVLEPIWTGEQDFSDVEEEIENVDLDDEENEDED